MTKEIRKPSSQNKRSQSSIHGVPVRDVAFPVFRADIWQSLPEDVRLCVRAE
jgi:hypothetical protein